MEKLISVKIKTVAAIIIVISAIYFFPLIFSLKNIIASWQDVDSYFTVVFIAAVSLLTISGVGLFFVKEWARRVTIVGAIMLLIHLGYVVIMSLSNIVEGELLEGLFASIIAFLMAIFLYGTDALAPYILFFFTRPEVKEQFRAPRPPIP